MILGMLEPQLWLCAHKGLRIKSECLNVFMMKSIMKQAKLNIKLQNMIFLEKKTEK